MTSWMARAKALAAEPERVRTDKTDERGVLSVSSVAVVTVFKDAREVSAVLSVPRWAVSENRTLAADLVDAAMKVCDRHGDGDAAREEMRRQCLELPVHLQADLLEHFRGRNIGDPEGQS
jgi:hypothetical protein